MTDDLRALLQAVEFLLSERDASNPVNEAIEKLRSAYFAALRGDALAKAEAENARLRFENTVNSEKMHSLQSEVTRLKAGLRMWHLAFKSGRNEQLQIVHEATTEFAALGGDDA
jgi:hypothetical protein